MINNISDFALWITNNSFYIIGIAVLGYLGYKAFMFYIEHEEDIKAYLKRFKKDKKTTYLTNDK